MNKIWYTDGACSGNPGPGGWAAIEMDELSSAIQITSMLVGKEKFTTNNRMELIAILEVCKLAILDKANTYYIYSDSAYAVNACNDWIWKWASNGWKRAKGKRIENLDIIKQLYEILKTEFCNIEIIKVSGHNGNIGNEMADALSNDNKSKEQLLIKTYNIDINKNI